MLTKTRMTRRRFLTGAVFAGLGAMGWPLAERLTLQREAITIQVPGLPPEANGLRIALLTDIHVGNFAGPELAERAAALAAKAQPDLVLIGGDLIHEGTPTRDVQGMAAALGQLEAPLGTFAVLGNHDYAAGAHRVVAALEDRGVKLLVNEGLPLEVGNGRSVWLAGLDDCWNGRPDLRQALVGAPGDAPKLLLVHEPDFADDVVRQVGNEVPLQLSGHSHGGQIRLPGAGAIHLPPMGRRYPIGLQRVTGSAMQVYTSRGIGVTGPPARLFCPPEVTIITLARGEGNGGQ